MKYILSYKVAQSFNIGMDLDQENITRYTTAVIDAIQSGHALLEELYEYPAHASNIIAEHEPDHGKFFTYLDFKIDSKSPLASESPEDLEYLRTTIIDKLVGGDFELVILWRRNFEAHIVFESKSEF